MGISFSGINTGLPPDIIDRLMDAERIPVKNIEGKKQKTEIKLNLVKNLEEKINNIRNSISELSNTRGFSDMQLSSGDPNIVQGIIDPQLATPGSWNIEVIQLANKASAITNGFPDKNYTQIGTGYLTFETPEGEKEVYINKANSTLEGVVSTINSANIGVHASIINDRKDSDYPYKLVLAGDTVGDDNQIKYPTLYFLDGDQDIFFENTKPAQNGIIKIDGFEIEVPENSLRDLLPGVTVELKQAAPGKNINISVKENFEVVSGKIDNFIKAINDVLNFIQKQANVNQSTDTSKTLGGESLIRKVARTFRSLLQNPVMGTNGSIKYLNQIGIQFNRYGTLEFDQKKFNSELAKDPQAVQAFFTGNGFSTGFIPKLRNTIGNLLDKTFGPVSLRSKGLEQKIERMNKQIDRKEQQLEKKEISLKKKFARLEETMSKLKAQGSEVMALGAQASVPQLNIGG